MSHMIKYVVKYIEDEKVCQTVAFGCGYLNIRINLDLLWICVKYVKYDKIYGKTFEDEKVCQTVAFGCLLFPSVLTVSNSEVSFPKDI